MYHELQYSHTRHSLHTIIRCMSESTFPLTIVPTRRLFKLTTLLVRWFTKKWIFFSSNSFFSIFLEFTNNKTGFNFNSDNFYAILACLKKVPFGITKRIKEGKNWVYFGVFFSFSYIALILSSSSNISIRHFHLATILGTWTAMEGV